MNIIILLLTICTLANATILGVHNTERKLINSPNLIWDGDIANAATKWASNCKFAHSNSKYGENIAAGTYGFYDETKLTQLWANEKKYIDCKTGKCPFEKCGHYTQMVWDTTTHIGCGSAKCTWNKNEVLFLVCQYFPAGNNKEKLYKC